jgi:hypothetical protein
VLGKSIWNRPDVTYLPTDPTNGRCPRVRIGVDGMQLVKRGF